MDFPQPDSFGETRFTVGIIINQPAIPGGFPDSGTALTFTMLFVSTTSVALMNIILFLTVPNLPSQGIGKRDLELIYSAA